MENIRTLGALRQSGYRYRSVKDELRENLVAHLRNKDRVFEGIIGFEDTVLPDVERAILSRHNMLLLGLRGQAKTRIARLLVHFLDEYIPVVEGSELHDDPLHPISKFARDLIAEKGDDTPIAWLHRSARYVEKLATPDVSVADLIGDVDPIKAATLKLPYSDERVIHFGLIPHAHRGIFVINELPDLQARIQVSLFNILQEGDIQIRGFKLRLPLDISFVFTANPEDYTNRGSIITPLKDRIESQILTHYPKSIDIARQITKQEAHLAAAQQEVVQIPELLEILLEQIVFEARQSAYVDAKSGVSARLSISAYENLVSAAERRALLNQESHTHARIADLWGVIPAITGKIELVYEGEQEGSFQVAIHLLDQALKTVFLRYFPDPDKLRKGKDRDPYGVIRAWFSSGNQVDILQDASNQAYQEALDGVAGLRKLATAYVADDSPLLYTYMELLLHGLASCQVLNKDILEYQLRFRDPLAGMLGDEGEDDDDFDEEDFN